MAKYRKKPVVIEAFQMIKERRWDNREWPLWLHDAWNKDHGEGAMWSDPDFVWAPGNPPAQGLLIGTLEGVHVVSPDDWIIRGIKGELYPCKPDIFDESYEPVE